MEMLFVLSLLVISAALAGAGLFALAWQRLAKKLTTKLEQQLSTQLDQQQAEHLAYVKKIAELMAQLQTNISKHDEQVQKLADFALRLKKEVNIIAERQAVAEEAQAPQADKIRFLH